MTFETKPDALSNLKVKNLTTLNEVKVQHIVPVSLTTDTITINNSGIVSSGSISLNGVNYLTGYTYLSKNSYLPALEDRLFLSSSDALFSYDKNTNSTKELFYLKDSYFISTFVSASARIFAISNNKIFYSDDKFTWITINPGLSNIIRMVQSSNGNLYLISNNGLSVSKNNGETWSILISDYYYSPSIEADGSNIIYSTGRAVYKIDQSTDAFISALLPYQDTVRSIAITRDRILIVMWYQITVLDYDLNTIFTKNSYYGVGAENLNSSVVYDYENNQVAIMPYYPYHDIPIFNLMDLSYYMVARPWAYYSVLIKDKFNGYYYMTSPYGYPSYYSSNLISWTQFTAPYFNENWTSLPSAGLIPGFKKIEDRLSAIETVTATAISKTNNGSNIALDAAYVNINGGSSIALSGGYADFNLDAFFNSNVTFSNGGVVGSSTTFESQATFNNQSTFNETVTFNNTVTFNGDVLVKTSSRSIGLQTTSGGVSVMEVSHVPDASPPTSWANISMINDPSFTTATLPISLQYINNQFVAVLQDSSGAIINYFYAVSTDAISWVVTQTAINVTPKNIAYGDGWYMATSNVTGDLNVYTGSSLSNLYPIPVVSSITGQAPYYGEVSYIPNSSGLFMFTCQDGSDFVGYAYAGPTTLSVQLTETGDLSHHTKAIYFKGTTFVVTSNGNLFSTNGFAPIGFTIIASFGGNPNSMFEFNGYLVIPAGHDGIVHFSADGYTWSLSNQINGTYAKVFGDTLVIWDSSSMLKTKNIQNGFTPGWEYYNITSGIAGFAAIENTVPRLINLAKALENL